MSRWLALLPLGLAVVTGFSRVVPYTMDEFAHYNEISYRYYPNNRLNTFDEGPGRFDLNVLGTGWVLPLRSYHYVGVVPALYYFPLFASWRDPLSARFMGILFLFLQSILLARIVRFRPEPLFLVALCFFPYLFQHLVETGLVGPQITCLLGTYLLLGRWFAAPTWGRALGAAGLVFLGVWTRLSFLWYGPGLLVVAAGMAWERRRDWARPGLASQAALQAAGAAAALTALVGVLFASTDPADPGRYPYLEVLFASSYGESHAIRLLLDLDYLRRLPVFDTLWNPWRAAERVFDPPTDLAWGVLYSAALYAAPLLLWLAPWQRGWKRPRNLLARSLLAYLAFWLTLLMVFMNREAWTMHHTILAYPFLALSLLMPLEALRDAALAQGARERFRKVAATVLAAFVALNSYYFVRLPHQRVPPENDPSLSRLNARLADAELARRYLYVALEWGVYFYQALYGHRDQGVLYVAPLTAERARRLEQLAVSTGRKLLFLYHPRLQALEPQAADRYFRVVPCDLLGEGSADDGSWQVLIQEDGAAEVCR